jgi:hypothetical protein
MQQNPLNKSNSKENNSSFIQKSQNTTQLLIDDINQSKSNSLKTENEEIKSKMSTLTIDQQISNLTLNHSENNHSPIINKSQRPTTSIIRNQTYANPSTSRFSFAKPSASIKKKSLLINRTDSVSNLPKQSPSTMESESSAYSHTIDAGRSISAVVHRSVPRSNDLSCSIREAKGAANRYNKPEQLFGLRPEELFSSEQCQPKILDQRSTTKLNENTRLKRTQFQQQQQQQQHIWQQDMDKIVELYNIHHSSNYRKSAIPPLVSTQGASQTETLTDLTQSGRVRHMSVTKNSSTNLKSSSNPKQSTFAVLNIPRRNSISRPSIKLTNT